MANPRFEKPGSLSVEYRRAREGPNSYLIWEAPGRSYICLTAEEVIKRTKWGRGTETGLYLRKWLSDLCEEGLETLPETNQSP